MLRGFMRAMFAGAGQVMFQQSVPAGVLMSVGVLVGSLSIGGEGRECVFLAAMLALCATTLLAAVCGYKGWGDGLAGFNAMLVGCAVFTFCDLGVWGWVLMLAASFLTLLLKRAFDGMLGASSYTLPFVVATWLMLLVGMKTGLCSAYVPETESVAYVITPMSVFIGLLKGVSQVFLIDSWLAGVIILAALAFDGVRPVVYAICGSGVGMLLAFMAGCPVNEILTGIWGFSPVLTALAVGTVIEGIRYRLIWSVLGILLTFSVQYVLMPCLAYIGVPVLTMPFCVATIMCAYLAPKFINKSYYESGISG